MKSVTDAKYNSDFGRTICEVHREIYDILFEEMSDGKTRDDVLDKLEESYQMAKKMDAKLRQYKNNYDDNWWEKERKNVVKEKLKNRRKRKDSK